MRLFITVSTMVLLFLSIASNAQSINDQLYQAVEKNNIALTTQLLAKGADANYVNRINSAFYINVLMTAVMNDYNAIATLLIEQGADVNQKDGFGMTALMWAAYNGNLPLVKLLVAKGADPNANDGKGTTALSGAREKKHTPVVAYLESLPATK